MKLGWLAFVRKLSIYSTELLVQAWETFPMCNVSMTKAQTTKPLTVLGNNTKLSYLISSFVRVYGQQTNTDSRFIKGLPNPF